MVTRLRRSISKRNDAYDLPSSEWTSFRTQSSSSAVNDNRDLLMWWRSLPRVTSDDLDASLPGSDGAKQDGGRRPGRTQHAAVIREHAGREDSRKFNRRPAFQKAPA